jgi:hypothetical protein
MPQIMQSGATVGVSLPESNVAGDSGKRRANLIVVKPRALLGNKETLAYCSGNGVEDSVTKKPPQGALPLRKGCLWKLIQI